MNPKNSLWQFVKDGLVGIVVILILFVILIPVFISQGNSWSELFGGMFFFQDSFISPMPFVILIGFISMGIGGRFLENSTSRWGILKPILIISIVAWIIGFVLFQIAFIEYLLDRDIQNLTIILGGSLGIIGLGAGVGFLIAGLAGVIFNPSQRIFRLIIGSIASTVVAYTIGFFIFVAQISL